ncbi:MAG: aminoacyl-tRNA hydrolase [Patescibacteria group bacterium]|nr:aminoacyl-tRNA hydrolase [Patescibacteria group bacterium]
MAWLIAGLGNPSQEYVGTRHNIGRDFLLAIAKKEGMGEWKVDKKTHSLVSKGTLFGAKVGLFLPEMYMNNSGGALKGAVTSAKQASQLVVLHDELDLPLGTVKISFGSGAGGHRGVESIQKALKTRGFVRLRIGISPATASGKLKRPDGERIIDFVLGKFRPPEQEKLKKTQKLVAEAIEILLTEGLAQGMTQVNSH